MTLYWMLDSQWPSFFGHIIDYYLKPGGAYFGAKKGLRPVGIGYDYYTAGDRSRASVYATNQTLKALHGLRAAVTLIALEGRWAQNEKLAIRRVEVLTAGPACWKRVDLRLDLTASYKTPFDPD